MVSEYDVLKSNFIYFCKTRKKQNNPLFCVAFVDYMDQRHLHAVEYRLILLINTLDQHPDPYSVDTLSTIDSR